MPVVHHRECETRCVFERLRHAFASLNNRVSTSRLAENTQENRVLVAE